MIRDAMMLSDELRNRISEALKPLQPEKVILFGSYAWGQPTEDSDIDLYVVTQDDFVPSTWRQKRDIVRSVSDRILDLRMRPYRFARAHQAHASRVRRERQQLRPPDHERGDPAAMIAQSDRQTALEFKRRITGLVPVLELCVFGSRARGDATVESDLDIFLVVDRIDVGLREKISEVAWEVGFENDVMLSTFVVTAEQLEHGPMGVSPIVRKIAKEGIRL